MPRFPLEFAYYDHLKSPPSPPVSIPSPIRRKTMDAGIYDAVNTADVIPQLSGPCSSQYLSRNPVSLAQMPCMIVLIS
jgi:hypothetical protein